MAYRSSASNNVNDQNLVITKPIGVVDGDILVVAVWSDNVGTTISEWSGFTEVTGSPLTSTLDGQRLFVGTKVAASEGSEYTFVGSSGIIGFIAAFSDRDSTLYLHRIATGESSAANPTPWNLTTGAFSGGNTSGTCDIVFIGASDITPSAVTTHTEPSGFTKRVDIQNTGGNSFYTGFLATKDDAASGETGVYTGTGTNGDTNSGWGAFALALLTSGGGGGGSISIPIHSARIRLY